MHREISARTAALGLLLRALTTIDSVRASGLTGWVESRWSALNRLRTDAEGARQTAEARWKFVSVGTSGAMVIVLAFLSVSAAARGALTPGLAAGMVLLIIACFHLARLASLRIGRLMAVPLLRAELDRIDRTPLIPDQDRRHTVATSDGSVAVFLENVELDQPGQGTPRLTGVSLTIRRGEAVAIVGPRHSGKSALLEVIAGLQAPSGGSVIIAEKSGVHNASVGYAAQRPQFLAGSIADNIAIDAPDLDSTAIAAALRRAQLVEDFGRVPLALESTIDINGSNLDASQRQRLAIARAIVRLPDLVVLDWTLEAIDARTACRILTSIREVSATVVLTTARPEIAMRADEVVVLDGGRVIARGAHDELLSISQQYLDVMS